MSRKRRRRGCGWAYHEWRRDEHGNEERRYAGWQGGPWSYAAAGPGFFGGRNFRILSGLRRDPWHGKVSGVCAGIGGYYGIRPKWIRIALIVSLFINPPLTILGYVIATVLLKPLPEPSFGGQGVGGQSEMNAGTSAQQQRAETKAEEELPPELRFAALKDKFRELEGRTGDIEGLVTSPEFRLRRDFKQMGEGHHSG
ncbi:MAG TPA: PspC domain-containing protein [Dongiaceae bacterium]|nr:PspC domain-containing protein [Dongiaceae bacterium]